MRSDPFFLRMKTSPIPSKEVVSSGPDLGVRATPQLPTCGCELSPSSESASPDPLHNFQGPL